MKQRIDILGGGLIGRLTALFLARSGHLVRLFDQADEKGEQSAAYAAAAMLAPMAEAVDATSLVISLGYESIRLWRELLSSLPEKMFMQTSGSLIIWHPQDKDLASQFSRDLQHAHHGKQTWVHWQQEHIAQYEPQLAHRFASGFYLPNEGQLHAREILLALAKALKNESVECHWHCKKNLDDLEGQADYLLDCRGFGSKQAWNDAHEGNIQLRGIRGEVAQVYAPNIQLNRPVRLLHPRYPLYVAPKENHIFIIGATQIESEDASAVSVRSTLELMSSLYAIHPAFGEARVLESLSQLRPTLSHHDPAISYQKERKIMSINGLFRHGFMISPAVSQAAVRLLFEIMQSKFPAIDEISGLPLNIIKAT